MKKLILFLFFLSSCSLNSNSSYWNESLNENYEVLKYEKDYSFNEYERLLNLYSNKNGIPKLN